MKTFWCGFFLASIYLPNSEAQQARIYSGKNAEDYEAPYMVAMRTTFDSRICGGAILSENYVVTAAHCIDEYENDPSDYFIITGTNQYRKPGAVYFVRKIIVHCNFDNPPPHNDIALLRLNTPIVWNNKTSPIELRLEPLVSGEPLLLTGYGSVKADDQVSQSKSDYLQAIDLNFIPYKNCRKRWDENYQVHKLYIGHVCAENLLGGTCHGDSGSPLVDSDKRLVGIVNVGYFNCKGINVFASTLYHMDWISIHLSKNLACTKCLL